MAHSVESHLAVRPDAYDDAIRRFVPGYEAMLRELTEALARMLAPIPEPIVLDLGAGTGALAACVLAGLPTARVILLDVDGAMLAQAEARLADHRARLELRRGSFSDVLPACDAAVASLSLHHIHDIDRKRAAYAGIRAALRPGGVLLSADAMVPDRGALAEDARRRWAAHLVAHGDTEAEALARFTEWAHEDRYFSIADELAALRTAGFAEADVLWRAGPTAVLIAVRGADES